ncbi:M20/M25/M40 family metallo-hydrolase, partial [Candidatus Dojkabacteria bacterium]|nr:M20/M25/M40 family metallo-hydrolase [Candidatus Dojkabacteria bacterium]
FLIQLLSYETTAERPDQLRNAVDLVEKEVCELGLKVCRFEKNKKPSIVLTSDGSKSPDIFLSGHLDVVPGSPMQFKPLERDGKVYARGASDMKGPVSAMLFAFKELVKMSDTKNASVGLMLTTDEEVGGFNGTKYLLNDIRFKSKVAFVPDTTSLVPYEVCTDEKAVWHIKISVSGTEAHGSRPWLGVNAIEKSMDISRQIKTSFDNKWGTPSQDFNWIPSVNIGKVIGGTATNKVPEKCELYLDIRFPEGISFESVSNIVSEIASRNNALIETLVFGSSNHIDKSNYYLSRWVDAVEKNTSHDVKYFRTHGASDGRYFHELGIPCVMSKPHCSLTHMKDEWVDYDSLVEFKDIIKKWVLSV